MKFYCMGVYGSFLYNQYRTLKLRRSKMKTHIVIDLIICFLVTIGFLIDGIQFSDLFFISSTYIWVFQDYIEKFIKDKTNKG